MKFVMNLCINFFSIIALLFSHNSSAQTELTPGVNAQLIVAARKADFSEIKKYLLQGASPNSRNRLGKTTLYLAIEKNRPDIVQLMLDSGADVNLSSVESVTPLIAASYSGNINIIDLILSKHPNLEATDRLHKSALIYAAGMGHREAVKHLIDAGAKVDASYIDALTPLMWAAGQGHAETVKLLLDKGANPNLADDRGLTAFDIAQKNNQLDALMVLKAQGP